MTNPDRGELVKLEAERAELIAKNEAATSWGAAVGARSERIKEIDGRIAALRTAPGATTKSDGVPGDAVGTGAAAAPVETGDAVVAHGPSDFCSDSDCEDQGLCPTDVCTKFECQQWVDDVLIRPALVLRGKYWVCPKCHSNYGEDAKGRTPPAPSDPSSTRSEGTVENVAYQIRRALVEHYPAMNGVIRESVGDAAARALLDQFEIRRK